MTYCPPERSPRHVAKSASDSQQVEAEAGQTKRRRRSRNFSRGSSAAIQRTAQQRQAAWLDGEPCRRPPQFDADLNPYRRETAELTETLDVLYADSRETRARQQ